MCGLHFVGIGRPNHWSNMEASYMQALGLGDAVSSLHVATIIDISLAGLLGLRL
jgi:hypothetical protein